MGGDSGSEPSNPLVSNQTSELQAILHPLVLLDISDYVTRHTLREHQGPVLGALLGQHNGREVTLEHAFDLHVVHDPDAPYQYRLDMERVLERIEHMRLVHKDRNLDFVGWYALMPKSGPSAELVQLQTEILSHVNESAVLLGFHPREMLDHSVGGRLPLTIFESIYEVDDTAKPDVEGDKKMHEDGEPPVALRLRFREIGYTVETGEAEMISMDFVARGSGNATAVEAPREQTAAQNASKASKSKSKGKDKEEIEIGPEIPTAEDLSNVVLAPEEEEMLSTLTAKANATKMLHSRIQLISAYLERLPAEYVAGTALESSPSSPDETTPSTTILRQIQALVGRLDLIEPSDMDAFRRELVCEKNDVDLVSLLTDVMGSLQQVRDVGRKFDIVDSAKAREIRSRPGPWDQPHGGKPDIYGSSAGNMMI